MPIDEIQIVRLFIYCVLQKMYFTVLLLWLKDRVLFVFTLKPPHYSYISIREYGGTSLFCVYNRV